MKKNIDNVISFIMDLAHKLSVKYDTVQSEQYAWWIIESITGQSKTKLLVQSSCSLTQQQQDKLTQWLDAIINHDMPLQYLIGSVPFYTAEILVSPPTLIPRPETEEWCIKLINNLKTVSQQNLTILDLCCGSGCIAIALAQAFPHAIIYATDISPTAVALTQKNSTHNKVRNIVCIQSDLFSAVPHDVYFDLIVSNPPYIDPSTWETLDKSVTAWEDPNALCAQDQGLALIKKIIAEAPGFIKNNEEMRSKNIAQLFLEIGYDQGAIVKNLMDQACYNQTMIMHDLAGKDRVVTGRVDNVISANIPR